jgi:hypothetical protein
VKSTPQRGLKQVDFRFDGQNLRGLEQNPDTKSRWAAMARSGKKVMQFLENGRYLAVVSDGKVQLYKKSADREGRRGMGITDSPVTDLGLMQGLTSSLD